MNRRFVLGAAIITCSLLGVLKESQLRAQHTFPGLPFINNYTSEQYNGGIQNWQISQDQRGILYVANNFGLLEFDGANWNIYPVRNGTKVRAIAIENSGRIFTGSQGDFGYFFPDASGQYQYISLIDSLPSELRNIDETWKVYIEDDVVYFCTFSNIYIFENEELRTVKSDLHLEPTFYINKRLFIQSPGHPLMTMNNRYQLDPIVGGEFYNDMEISAVLPFRKDEILLVTKRSGIFVYNGMTSQLWLGNGNTSYSDYTFNCAIRLNDGRIAVGTQSSGLILLDELGTMLLQLSLETGLASNTVLSLFQDKDHNLWAGLSNGISHIELASPFTVISNDMGVEGTGYAAMIENSKLLLGTNIALFQSNETDNGNFQSHNFKKIPGSEGQVYNITKINRDLFVGHHNGAFMIENEAANRITQTGTWTFIANPLSPDKIIAGTYSGLNILKKEPNGSWDYLKRMFGFYESSRIMQLDDENNLWMTHGYKGAFKIKLDFEEDSILNVKYYNQYHGFPSNILINVFKIKNELIFTAENGIYTYDKKFDKFVPHAAYTKLLGSDIHIRDMDEDPLGNIYFITEGRCGVIREASPNQLEVDMNSFNRIPKYLNDDLVNVNALDINNVLFAGKEGFIHYEPNKNVRRADSFSILIRKVFCTTEQDSILFNGNHVDQGGIIDHQAPAFTTKLPYSNNDLRFSYAATYYEGVDDIRYRYNLKGFDSDWSSWNNKTEKEYTNLPEGEYEFRVMAQNVYGQQSDIAAYRFIIGPPWYRSFLAYVSYALGGIFLIVIGMLVVDRKHKKEKMAMQKAQNIELSNKETQLKTIREQKEAEITRLRNDKLKAELSHKNTELASITMHLLTKSELLGDIKSKLAGIKSQNDAKDVKKNLNQILKEIELNLDLDKDWEQFEFHFDRVHSDFNKRIKESYPELTPQEMKLCAYLRLNFSTKEIAQLLHISVRGVEISRYRLRKKLNLSRDQNLSEFILEF